jgi:hypothetical protein
LVATCLHEEEKPESVEKVSGGCFTQPNSHHLVPN